KTSSGSRLETGNAHSKPIWLSLQPSTEDLVNSQNHGVLESASGTIRGGRSMLNLKKDAGLFVLIMVVGTVVSVINPRFLSPINIANTANLVGLFGVFSIAEGLMIITGGIDLSAGSVIALLGVIFVDLIANRGVPWPLVVLIVVCIGLLLGLINGLLITKKHLQPFI